MYKLLSLIVMLVMATLVKSQDTTSTHTAHTIMGKQSMLLLPASVNLQGISASIGSTAPQSIMRAPMVYSYTQGKLPLFCAFEERIWRRTGLGMQFRLIDRPLGQ